MSNLLARRKSPRPHREGESKHMSFDSVHYPRAGEFSLFDIPALLRQCIDALKAQGISRVELQRLVIVNGKLQLHIHYFRALEGIGECMGIGYDAGLGQYRCFRFAVNAAIDIVWLKNGGEL